MRATIAGAIAGLGIAVAAAGPMFGAIGDLSRARSDRAVLRAAITAPPPPPAVADARRIAAADAEAAGQAIGRRLRQLASAGGVLVERAEPRASASPNVAVLRLAASGSERAVIAFADMVERGRPGLRWRSWRMTAMAGGAVRVDGEILVPWR